VKLNGIEGLNLAEYKNVGVTVGKKRRGKALLKVILRYRLPKTSFCATLPGCYPNGQ
jgi:hypothetical protein